MRITVFGASGQIGGQVCALVRSEGHDVVEASRNTGVDVLSGVGVADSLQDAHVLVDVLNSPSFDDGPVLEFFSTATRNLIDAARAAGVAHYVALSIVGDTGLPDSGYMRAKVAQETLIEASGLPYTILRATQFQEFADAIVASMTTGDVVRVPDGRIQPIAAAAEVAAHVARARRSAHRPVWWRSAGRKRSRSPNWPSSCSGATVSSIGSSSIPTRPTSAPGWTTTASSPTTARCWDGSAHLISARTVPCVMAAPASTASPVITPSLWAVTGFSIFMASSTTTRSPAATV